MSLELILPVSDFFHPCHQLFFPMHEFLSKSHTTLRAECNPITPMGNSIMVARSVVARERNERGFREFLQHLKTVSRLFLSPENENLAPDGFG